MHIENDLKKYFDCVYEPEYSNEWLRVAEKFTGFTTHEVLNLGDRIGELYFEWLHNYIINISNGGIYSEENEYQH